MKVRFALKADKTSQRNEMTQGAKGLGPVVI